MAAAVLGLGTLSRAPDVVEVRDKLDAYLLDYKDKLASVVATEVNAQALDDAGAISRTRMTVEPGVKRRIESEVSFGTLPGEAGWLGFRRVQRVNGKQVGNPKPSVDELLRDTEHHDAAKKLLEESARHNLGSFRNTNLPNLPLELLHPRHRHRFDHTVTGTGRIDGTPVTILVAHERELPSIIQSVDGTNVSNTVTAWVDDSGRLLQAEVRSRAEPANKGQVDQVVWVKFKVDTRLDLLVPIEMREVFWSANENRRGTGVARYRDFRRFETSARIIPPG